MTVWEFFKKLKTESPHDLVSRIWGMYPDKTIIRKNTCTLMFTAALFTIAKPGKKPKCPLTDKMHKDKGDQPWVFFARTDAKGEILILWPPHAKS